MKTFLFLANDPGGLDSILPVYNKMVSVDDVSARLMLTGKAAEKEKKYKSSETAIIDYIDKELSKNKEFMLVTGTSWNSIIEVEAINRCKKSGIKTVSILDYWSNYKKRFAYKDGYCFPDYLFVMDDMACVEAKEDGIPNDIIKITGNPGLDVFVNKSNSRKKVLFLSQPLSLVNTDNEGYSEFDAFEDVLKACGELELCVNIKFHPKETEEMKERYGYLSINGNLEEVVFGYDVIVGMSTMGLLQCALMGIPIISYQPNLISEDKCITNKLNISKGAYNYIELIDQLKKLTGTIDKKRFPFLFDGNSSNRCISELLSIYGE